MASGRELCYFMLSGILLCYLVTFILVSKPNVAICAASRILIGLSMSAIYAAILTKTNLLARIFLMQSVGRLDCIVPSAQVSFEFYSLILVFRIHNNALKKNRNKKFKNLKID